MTPSIRASFWSDPEIENASPEAKLTVLWLLTNSQTTILGVCNASGRRFTFETGLDPSHLAEACKALPRMLKSTPDGIWIRNFIHHQFGTGERLAKNNCVRALRNSIDTLKDASLRKEVVEKYPELTPSQGGSDPLPTPSGGGNVEKSREKKGSGDGAEGEEFDFDPSEPTTTPQYVTGSPAEASEAPQAAQTPPAPQTLRREALGALARRINVWHNRRDTTKWSTKEKKLLAGIYPVDLDTLVLMEKYYTATLPKDQDFRRKDIFTMLNNWPGEVDRAVKFSRNGSSTRRSAL